MKTADLPLFSALEARDRAIDQVSDNSGDFMSDAISAMRRMEPGDVTGEDVRNYLSGLGIEPHHHNAWGALIMLAIKHGVLHPTDQFRNMRGPKSHGRMTRVYMVKS